MFVNVKYWNKTQIQERDAETHLLLEIILNINCACNVAEFLDMTVNAVFRN